MNQGAGKQHNLGRLIHEARISHNYTFKTLATLTGVAQSQLSKLEKNQIKKVNPAHLALLAEPLDLTLHELYQAAGFKTPSALAQLSDELEAKIRQLPPDAISRLEQYVESLLGSTPRTVEVAVTSADGSQDD